MMLDRRGELRSPLLAMAAFLFAFLAALMTGLGARDQLLVAALAARRGPRPGLLVTALLVAGLSAGIAGWAGELVAPQLNPRARILLVAMALGLAALELIVLRPRKRPGEPTESLGALAVVLLAHQLTDAARLLVFALAAASAVPIFAVAGGIVGCVISVTFGAVLGESLLGWPLGKLRIGLGLILGTVAAYLASQQF